MLDVVYAGGERAFVERDDATRHIVGRQAGVTKDDTDHRDIDVWEDVDRRAQRRRDTEDHDQHRHDDEGIRTPKREFDNSDHDCLPLGEPSNPRLVRGTKRQTPPKTWLLAAPVTILTIDRCPRRRITPVVTRWARNIVPHSIDLACAWPGDRATSL